MKKSKYTEVCSVVRQETKARVIILGVIDGVLGSGMCVQGAPEDLVLLPEILEGMARKIRSSLKQVTN